MRLFKIRHGIADAHIVEILQYESINIDQIKPTDIKNIIKYGGFSVRNDDDYYYIDIDSDTTNWFYSQCIQILKENIRNDKLKEIL